MANQAEPIDSTVPPRPQAADDGFVEKKAADTSKSEAEPISPCSDHVGVFHPVVRAPWYQSRFFKMALHLTVWMIMTGWWVVGLVLHRELGWIVPFLVWLGFSVRLLTWYVSARHFWAPVKVVWHHAVRKPVFWVVPAQYRLAAAAVGTAAVMLVGTFVTEESANNKRADRAVSMLGLAVAILSFWATSRDRRRIQWQTVIVGMLAQFVLALFVLRTKAGRDIFTWIADLARSFLGESQHGTEFLTDKATLSKTWFLLLVIPPIIFFVAFIQLLLHWGVVQWVVSKFATVFFYGMKVSGAESVVAAASPFIGQGESVMLIKPFMPHLTKAEIHQVMASGFATVSGSVMYAYISMGVNPAALVSSCVMSIPASLAVSKMRYPETEEPVTAGRMVMPENDDQDKHQNSLEAFAKGSALGIVIAGMVVAGVLSILSMLGAVDGLLTWWGHYLGIEELTVELIVGYLLYPVSFLLGVTRNGDVLKVAKLIAMKVVANEYVAYKNLLNSPDYADLSTRSRLIATYAVCGFGNISSIGIQIGVLGQLAPGRSAEIARLAVSALITGVVATLSSAAIAGMLIVD